MYDEKNEQLFKTTEEMKLVEATKQAQKEKESLIDELKKRKTSYETGVWNAQSILLGGLGKEPLLDESDDPIVRLKHSLKQTKSKTNKVELFKKEMEINSE